MKKNDIIKFGKYDWRVLKVKKDRVLIISMHVLENRAFDQITNKWKKCSLKDYLNGEFLSQFSQDEQNRIADKGVFLLGIERVKKCFDDPADRIAKNRDGEPSWWRFWSPGDTSFSAAHAYTDGPLSMYGCYVDWVDGGIRPALWLKHEAEKTFKMFADDAEGECFNEDEFEAFVVNILGRYNNSNNMYYCSEVMKEVVDEVSTKFFEAFEADEENSLLDETIYAEDKTIELIAEKAVDMQIDSDYWKAKAEAESKRADKWERRYTETSEHLDEVLTGNHVFLDAIREKVAELQADRDHWKARAEKAEDEIKLYDMFGGVDGITATITRVKALERAIKANIDNLCFVCRFFTLGKGSDIHSLTESCTCKYPCENAQYWEFAQERFTEKKGGNEE